MKEKIKNPLCKDINFAHRVIRGTYLFDPLKFWRFSYREHIQQSERLTCSGFKIKLSRR